MSNSLYVLDFFVWTSEQTALLHAGRLVQLDIDNRAEEIGSMGRSQKRELNSRWTVLLWHLLKWQHQPGLRGVFWRRALVEAEKETGLPPSTFPGPYPFPDALHDDFWPD